MNKLTKPTADDVFESILYNYLYPCTDTIKNTVHWIFSQDIKDEQSLRCMELEENFVESVAKSKELPFVFDKSMEGTIIKKGNRLGELFYDLLVQQNVSPANLNSYLVSTNFKIRAISHPPYTPRYEESENLKVLASVAEALNLNHANFTGNPMSKISNEGLLEGELINSFVTRLREAMKRKSFKARAAERKKESSQSFTKTKRYIDRLCTNNPGSLYGVRMVIYYSEKYAKSITLEGSHTHLMSFLETSGTDLTSYSPIGWWWKREYMTELSYYYSVILFFDIVKNPYNEILIKEVYDRHWSSVTEGRGEYYVPSILQRDYQRCGMGVLQQMGKSGERLDLFLSITQRMLMRDIFLRLEPNKKFNHFGMGELPKLAEVTPVNNTFSPYR
jgi:hypothetical protein